MNFEKFGLKEILTKIQETEEDKSLAQLEEALLFECARRIKAGQNWKEVEDAKTLSKQVIELCGRKRRYLLSIPTFQKQKDEYDLGRKIGKSV